jgi:protein-L-isoaspartate(D-aspartate) O-methyltransferase
MDIERARHNMVEQQIRPWEVLDVEVLGLFQRCPRDAYVSEEYRALAYADTRIPLGEGQVMMLPREEARLLQALQLEPGHSVLEIGTGSGYLTSLLAASSRHVTSVEISANLSERARRVLAAEGTYNITLEVGDGLRGWPDGSAPYDAIALTGSVYELDPALLEQLEVGGRLFAIVGQAPAMEACLVTRTSKRQWDTESLFETVVPPLIGAGPPRRFHF